MNFHKGWSKFTIPFPQEEIVMNKPEKRSIRAKELEKRFATVAVDKVLDYSRCPIENQTCFESARELFGVCEDCPTEASA